ncbi:hypothetical protein [Bacillus sp. REN16]|uniref:hypothetical protein n=1 Tax=Bacillus sp. REN16 TaxID=2887296 RepID=UPI001E468364|nr:hypothetical protein [Bacillus sp. REN16]MCC3359546.1 hypothetical protein [Bacillus sp. REN16]
MTESKINLEELYGYLSEIGSKILSGELEVESIPQFTRNKIDINNKLSILHNFTEIVHIKEKAMMKTIEDVWLYDFLDGSNSSFIAPAYHLNQYLDLLEEFNIYNLNKGYNDELDLIKYKFSVEVHNLFFSIKSLLDRLVAIFSFYYPGIQLKTTFGRMVNKKPSGLMSKVNELKDKDDLMAYIYEEYFNWIQSAVSPRDLVTHYNDLGIRQHSTIDGRIIPYHVERVILQNNKKFLVVGEEMDDDLLDDLIPNEFTYKDLIGYVNHLYEFLHYVFEKLKDKDFKSKRVKSEIPME